MRELTRIENRVLLCQKFAHARLLGYLWYRVWMQMNNLFWTLEFGTSRRNSRHRFPSGSKRVTWSDGISVVSRGFY